MISWWAEFVQELRRILGLVVGRDPEPDLVGPLAEELPLVNLADVINASEGNRPAAPVWHPSGEWSGGWWSKARKVPAHPGRVGRTIVPSAVVVHTTDTLDGFNGMVKRWTTEKGSGGCCHFMIGRTANDGVVQLCSITNNGNHAGGRLHGNWKTGTGALVHPNTVSVGIEVVGGGRLRTDSTGKVYHKESGKVVPMSEVWWDNKARPWHVTTPYQMATLQILLVALESCLKPMPAGWTVAPSAIYAQHGAEWAMPFGRPPRVVSHATLTPDNKTDCGPQIYEALKLWAQL